MIVDQLFTPKPLKEGGPYDLPGKDYDRPGDTPRKRPSSEHNPYPYSPEEDDDHFREIFRKKREAAKQQGMAEGNMDGKVADIKGQIAELEAEQEQNEFGSYAYDTVDGELEYLYAKLDKAEKGVAESKRNKQRKLAESMLMEDPIYRNFKGIGRYIAERKLTEPEILQVFADAETGMTDKGTGANRTMLGRGKDTTMDFAGGVADALKGVWSGIQNSVPVAAVDVAYDQATDALANLTGGQKGAVMQAIKKYRNLAKEYPKTAGLSKAALIAITGLATGGAGLPAVAALVYGLDSSIKGEKLSDIALKAGGAAATAWAAGKLFGGGTQPGPTDSVAGLVDPTPDLATYTVQSGDTLSQIAQANNTSVQELIGLNPQLAADSGAVGGQSLNPDVIFPGQEITLPPGTPGTDVYAGGVGTNANTTADIAKGQVPDSSITQGMANKGQAAASSTSDVSQAAVDPSKYSAPIDYSQPGPASVDSLGQKLEYGMPVNDKGSFVPPNSGLPAEELAKQTAAYNSWKADFMKRFPNATLGADGSMLNFKPGLAPMYPGMTPKTFESVKLRMLPANKLIDQKATVLNWALNESVGRKSHSVNLTAVGAYTVFENVERYRLALLEYVGTQPGRPELPDQYRPDMPDGAGVPSKPGLFGRGLNALDRGVKKVGGALSNFGHQFTTGVTKEKLKMNWQQAGKPSDSDQLAAWLTKQGVPQEVVTGVYSKMSIPYTAPAVPDAQPAGQTDAQVAADPAQAASTGGAQRQMAFYGNNPATKKPWTYDELQAKSQVGAATPTNTAEPDATTAPATTAPATTATKTTAGGLPGFNASNVMNLPGMEKYAKKPATPPAKTPNFAGPGGYSKVTQSFKTPGAVAPAPTKTPTQAERDAYVRSIGAPAMAETRIATALKKPVAEMLQMVETKEDVQKIKQFVDQTFTRYGAVNESAFAIRNQILEHVTQVGAQRRREHSQRVAH